jgi:hypothetical protein
MAHHPAERDMTRTMSKKNHEKKDEDISGGIHFSVQMEFWGRVGVIV